jgi:drug/metabolite transporter (DMT)-like permease
MKKVLLLGACFLVASSSGVFLKLASMYKFLSFPYIFYFGITVLVMGVYAVLWQEVLKLIPLNKAYLYKSSGVGISLMYAYIIFDEKITVYNIIGCSMIVAGIIILSYKRRQEE